MRRNERTWLLTIFCFAHFTTDSLDLIAVSTDAIKNFAAAQASGLNQGNTMSNVLQRCAVEVLPEAFLLDLILTE